MKNEARRIPEHVDRIVGAKKYIEDATDSLRWNVAEPKSRKQYEERVIPLEEQNKKLFNLAAQRVAEFAKQYGGNPREYDISMLDVTRSDALPYGGHYHPVDRRVMIIEARPAQKFHVLLHELIHYASFNSFQINENNEKPSISGRRFGVAMRVRKDKQIQPGDIFFKDINEAITEECAKRMMPLAMKNPEIRGIFRASEEVKTLLRAAQQSTGNNDESQEKIDEIMYIDHAYDILDSLKEDHSTKALLKLFRNAERRGDVHMTAYPTERQKLHAIMNDMVEKGNGKFANVDEVFDFFARAHFSGRLLPLARLVEQTLGEGAFRKMGEETGTPAIQKAAHRNIFTKTSDAIRRWWTRITS